MDMMCFCCSGDVQSSSVASVFSVVMALTSAIGSIQSVFVMPLAEELSPIEVGAVRTLAAHK
jgi:hypothetical protein